MALTDSHVARTRTSIYSMIEDGIVEQRLLPDVRQTVVEAQENLAAFSKLAGHRGAALLVDLREGGPVAPGVNDVYGSEEAASHTHALALLTSSPVSQMVGNLYLGLKRPRMPTRLFRSRSEALMWLRRTR